MWSSNPTPEHILANMMVPKNTCTSMFIAVLFTIAKTWKKAKCPSRDEWIKKMWYIYTIEYYSAIKKKGTLPFTTTWMELEGIMLSEISQTEKTNTVWSHLYVESKKTELIETENSLVVARGGSWEVNERSEGGWRVQTFRYEISPRDVMYSTATKVNNTILFIWKLLRE